MATANGNGQAHVEAESVPAEVVHRPFEPGKIEQRLHRRLLRRVFLALFDQGNDALQLLAHVLARDGVPFVLAHRDECVDQLLQIERDHGFQ